MKDSELQFDRTCHVLYSKPCKRQIREKIALHYPEGECETVWERVQRQYVTFLRDWRTGRSSRRRRPATSGVSVGRGLNVVSASVLRRDDTTFKAPCKILQTCGTCYNNCPVCGTRLGYTPSCQPIPVHFVAANRDTSSKPPRFIRHWRRFGDFQKPWFLAAFFGYFLSLVKESNSPKAK